MDQIEIPWRERSHIIRVGWGELTTLLVSGPQGGSSAVSAPETEVNDGGRNHGRHCSDIVYCMHVWAACCLIYVDWQAVNQKEVGTVEDREGR